ncbi:MAG: hypothetical protein IKX58_09085 [Clostridia bacterium]|nr:hypothetical protein [Clostridia bacterium]
MNRILKKIMSIILCAVMISAVMPNYVHAATSTAHVSISVTPRELASEGKVTVSITLTNTNNSGGSTTPTAKPVETDKPTITTVPGTPTPAPTQGPQPTEVPSTPEPSETDDAGTGSLPGGKEDEASVSGIISTKAVSSIGTKAVGDYTNITISNSYGVSFNTQGVVIAAGSKKTFTGSMSVSSGMIGVELPFTVSWNDNNQKKSETVTCKISRLNTSPYLTVVRTANPVNASVGTEVTLTYTFTNSGSISLSNITLVDRYVKGSSSPLLSPFSLTPGATKVFTYSFTMGNSTIVSSPVVKFYAQGNSTELVKNVASLTIGLIQSQLTKEIIAGTPTPDGVKFTIYLTNNGNQKLSSLVVTDERGSSVSNSPFSLAVGETKVLQYFVSNPSTVRYVVFNIDGKDYNGTDFKDNTSSYVVRPYIDSSLLGLTFTAVTTTSLSEDNVISFELSFENTGSLDYHNLSVTEKELGYEIYKLESLNVGKTEKASVTVNIGDLSNLVFILTAEDPSGNTHTHEAYVTAERMNIGEMIPSNDPTNNGGSVDVIEDDSELGKKLDGLITDTGTRLMSWFRVLGVIAIIAAVAMIVLGVSEIVIRRNKRNHK